MLAHVENVHGGDQRRGTLRPGRTHGCAELGLPTVDRVERLGGQRRADAALGMAEADEAPQQLRRAFEEVGVRDDLPWQPTAPAERHPLSWPHVS